MLDLAHVVDLLQRIERGPAMAELMWCEVLLQPQPFACNLQSAFPLREVAVVEDVLAGPAPAMKAGQGLRQPGSACLRVADHDGVVETSSLHRDPP
eukprot:13336605-Heterocapsa_arctica.AAC.1